MESFMMKLKERVVVGLVGGSDLDKIEEQMNDGTKHGKSFSLKILTGHMLTQISASNDRK